MSCLRYLDAMTSSGRIALCPAFFLLLSLPTNAVVDGSVDCREYGLPGQVFVDWRVPASGRYETNGMENVYFHGIENDTFILWKHRYWNIGRQKDSHQDLIARVKDRGLTELPLHVPHAWEPDEILIYCPVKCKSRVNILYESCLSASGTYVAESYLSEKRNCSKESERNRTHEQDGLDGSECDVCSDETADPWRPMTYKLGEWTLQVDPVYLAWTFGLTTTRQTKESSGNVLGYHPPVPCPDRLSTSEWLIYDSKAKELLPGKNSLHIFEPDTCGCRDRNTNYSYFYSSSNYSGFYLYKDNDTWAHESDNLVSIVLSGRFWKRKEGSFLTPFLNATACLENIKDNDHKFYCEQDLKVSSRLVVTENGTNTTLFVSSSINRRPSYTLFQNKSGRTLYHKITGSKKGIWVLSGVCTIDCKRPKCKIGFSSWNYRPYPLTKRGCTINEDWQGEMVKISEVVEASETEGALERPGPSLSQESIAVS